MRSYRETDGEIGHDWRGTQTLLLTTTGRKSGKPRTTPLIYGRSGEDYPSWPRRAAPTRRRAYVNLSERPDVEVQVRGDRFRARARTATAQEKPAMWTEMTGHWSP